MATSAISNVGRLLGVARSATTSRDVAPTRQAQQARPRVEIDGAAKLASLLKGAGFMALSPADWRAIASTLSRMTPDQRAKVTEDFALRNMMLMVQPDGQEVTVMNMGGQATMDLRSRELRINAGGTVTVYQDDQAVETIARRWEDGKLQVVKDGQTQLWDRDNGKGTTVDGKPLPVRWADPVPGEAKRKPWPAPLPSQLHLPAIDDSQEAARRQYEAAIVAAGGEIVEPMDLDSVSTSRYNCHSFAVTDAHGDLMDPFDEGAKPRWVNMPTYQFANGPFKKLAPDQKVHPGDVIMYADADGVPSHTGRVTKVDADGNPSQVESKWGGYGLYKHAPFDVPESYGHIEAFYRPDAAK